MDGSIEWEKFHPIEDENDFPNSKDRMCPRCGTPVAGRPNKLTALQIAENATERAHETQLLAWRRGERMQNCTTGPRD